MVNPTWWKAEMGDGGVGLSMLAAAATGGTGDCGVGTARTVCAAGRVKNLFCAL